MTVKQLIAKLKKMPPNAKVGLVAHDQNDDTVDGWGSSVNLILKSELNTSNMDSWSQEIYESMPEMWVAIHA